MAALPVCCAVLTALTIIFVRALQMFQVVDGQIVYAKAHIAKVYGE